MRSGVVSPQISEVRRAGTAELWGLSEGAANYGAKMFVISCTFLGTDGYIDAEHVFSGSVTNCPYARTAMFILYDGNIKCIKLK